MRHSLRLPAGAGVWTVLPVAEMENTGREGVRYRGSSFGEWLCVMKLVWAL